MDQCREQIQLLLEQHFVITERKTEQRKGLGEGATAEDHFGTAVRQRIDGREALEHANRIVGRQYGDGGAETDPLRARGDGRQHDFGRGHREIGAMMFADADEVDAELVGKNRFLDQVAQHLGVRQRRTIGAGGNVPERIETEFEDGLGHGCTRQTRGRRRGCGPPPPCGEGPRVGVQQATAPAASPTPTLPRKGGGSYSAPRD